MFSPPLAPSILPLGVGFSRHSFEDEMGSSGRGVSSQNVKVGGVDVKIPRAGSEQGFGRGARSGTAGNGLHSGNQNGTHGS